MRMLISVFFSLVFASICSSPLIAADLAFDPTRPSAYVAPVIEKKKVVTAKPKRRADRYRLQSIIIGENRRIATINNKAYSLGETLDGGGMLITVMPDYVEVKRYNQTKKLSLLNTQIRQ